MLTFRDMLKPINEFWGKQKKKTKIILISVLSGLVVFAFIITMLLYGEDYVVLYSGLDPSEAGEIMVRLSEMNINAKMESEGIISVPADEEARLKMTLSSEGYPQSTLNYDIFSDNSGFMVTDFEKKKYLLFQLQNRLQDAIKTIQGIKSAIVTISLTEEGSYVLETDRLPATASVVLTLQTGAELVAKQIKGIEELVAKSTPGLESKNIAIVNHFGEMLNDTHDEVGGTATYTRLEIEKSISSDIESRIFKLLQPVFGSNSIRIAVNTSVDLSKKTSAQTIYSPVVDQSGIILSQSISKQSTGGDTATGGVPGTSTNTGVPVYAADSADKANVDQTESSDTDYLVSELKEQVERDGYEISDISVAVILGNDGLSKEELLQYREMISLASGVSLNKVAVSTATFISYDQNGEVQSPQADVVNPLTLQQLIILASAASVILLIFIIFAKRMNKKRSIKRVQMEDEAAEIMGKNQKATDWEIPGEIILNETRQKGLKRQIKDFSSVNPDIAAQLLRTWIKEGDEGDDG